MTGWVADHFAVRMTAGSSPVGLEVTDLVQLGLRRNPRRAHLLVSTVLGKHLPVDARSVVGAGRLLGALVDLDLADAEVPGSWTSAARATVLGTDPLALWHVLPQPRRTDRPLVVLGFAETATALGDLVADQLGARWYLHSTRRPEPGVPVAGGFEEGHSHATSHLLQPVPSDLMTGTETLVLVDDELSTGKTAIATIRELHQLSPRDRYVIACLVDLRGPADAAAVDELAAELGCRITVVALASGSMLLPADLPEQVAQWQDGPGALTPGPAPLEVGDDPEILCLEWPLGLSDSGRHGLTGAERTAVDAAVGRLADRLRGHLPSPDASVLVIGTEEYMAIPLRLAAALAGPLGPAVGFQSTTRSPVWPVDEPHYPVRRRFVLPPTDAVDDGTSERFLYNAFAARGTESRAAADVIVVVGDSGSSPEALRRVAGLLSDAAPTVLAVQITSTPVLPEPLVGPDFGSYAADEAGWLLTDLSHLDLEGDVAEREARIQSGQAHYAESLPVEYQPDEAYRELFDQVLAESADRLATAVGLVTELVLAERGTDIVLVSLARAGTPIGILMRRWAASAHGLSLPHHAVSIVRGRGIDRVALGWLARTYGAEKVVFVDGWTGKGAIAKELTEALDQVREQDGWNFNDDLAVLADPGHCVRTFGTRDDFLIASACLNSTVSGLISRTVLNPAFLAPGQFHGAKFYREFADIDVSNTLLDKVSERFPAVRAQVEAELPALRGSDRTVTFEGWAAVEKIREEYGISSVNFVKPGVGETTRVLLRRVPWKILVAEADHPDHHHLRLLAADRDVPIEVRPDLPYSCVGLIRPLSAGDRGEG